MLTGFLSAIVSRKVLIRVSCIVTLQQQSEIRNAEDERLEVRS